MEQATGIGGLFFRARDAQAFAQWYRERLGVALALSNREEPPRLYDPEGHPIDLREPGQAPR